jgi:tetratricopeptide (TPR) repeat protein
MRQTLRLMKWLFYVGLLALLVTTWAIYSKGGRELKQIEQELVAEKERGDPEERAAGLQSAYDRLDQQHTFSGILVVFLLAGLLGIVFVVQVLPIIAHRVTHAVYDSAEMVEKDPMRDARSLVAQGDYEGAIEAFKVAADAEPNNRLPWVEIAKIQREQLEDPAAAVATVRHALERHAWPVNDAAYFLFRLAELHDEGLGDRDSAVAVMQQVMVEFPETRHAANARHKLHEWGLV